MTGKHLPPDTGREISGLKRRVSDLERMLDRVRRGVVAPTPPVVLPPFALITETDAYSTGTAATGWDDGLTYYADNGVEAPDATGTIRIDGDLRWTFAIAGPGWFELGATVRFRETTGGGARAIGVTRLDLDPIERSDIAVVARAPAVETVLSGSRVLWCDGARLTVWFGHDAGEDLDVRVETYWARLVSRAPNTGPPIEA